MAVLKSQRFRNHVVFHCPACSSDRHGRVLTGIWAQWPGEHEQTGPHIECVACAAQTSH